MPTKWLQKQKVYKGNKHLGIMQPDLKKILANGLMPLMPDRRRAIVYFFINDLNNTPKLIEDLQSAAQTTDILQKYPIRPISIPSDFLPEGAQSPLYTDFVYYINSVSSGKDILVVQNIEDYFLRMGTKFLKDLNPEKDRAKIKQEMCGAILDGGREIIHKDLKQPIGLIIAHNDNVAQRVIYLDAFTWKARACYLEEHY